VTKKSQVPSPEFSGDKIQKPKFLATPRQGEQQLRKTSMSQTQDAEMADAPTGRTVEDGLVPGELEEESVEKLIRIVSLLASHCS
jgi:hypothetical protein